LRLVCGLAKKSDLGSRYRSKKLFCTPLIKRRGEEQDVKNNTFLASEAIVLISKEGGGWSGGVPQV
jgi:hypothetical protein